MLQHKLMKTKSCSLDGFKSCRNMNHITDWLWKTKNKENRVFVDYFSATSSFKVHLFKCSVLSNNKHPKPKRFNTE